MAPWWLRSAEDEAPIDVIEMTDDESAAQGESRSPDDSRTDATAEDGGGKRKRSRSRSRRRRRGAQAEAAESIASPPTAEANAPKPDPAPETKARPEVKARPEAKPQVEAEPRPEPKREPKAAPAPKHEPIAEPPPEADKRADAEHGDGETPSRPRRRRRRRGRSDAATPPEPQRQEAPAPVEPAADTEPTETPEPSVPPSPKPTPTPAPATAPPAPIATPAAELPEPLSSGVVYIPDRGQDERKIAMFFDFENIALGVRDTKDMTFDVGLVLARLLEKGKIIVKRAYADWQRYAEFKRPLHEAAIEMIDIPKKRYSGKNSADIKMVVDAMDLCYAKEHLDTFVLVSGDSDFSPLVSKLKENDKYVIGLGMKGATSHLLVDNCDEFIYYEDVWRDAQRTPRLSHVDDKSSEVFQLIVEAMQALIREDKDVLWGSMIKQTMKRKRPSFNEGYYGYSTFSELLEDAEKKDVIRLRRDQRSGGYIVTGFASRQPPAKR